eukprot:14622065-Ditylum_brightwellii.AAC.1
MEMQSEKCPLITPLPKKKQNTNNWLSLPLGKKESKRKRNVDVDTEQLIFDCTKSNLKKKKTLEQLISGGHSGQISKEESSCSRRNLKAFWSHFSTKKPGDELYSFESLTSCSNETSDESDDAGELAIKKEVTNQEKSTSSYCIININHLGKVIEDNT